MSAPDPRDLDEVQREIDEARGHAQDDGLIDNPHHPRRFMESGDDESGDDESERNDDPPIPPPG